MSCTADGDARPDPSTGYTLVELLVALVLSLMLTGLLFQLYSGSRTAHQLQNSLGELQQNGRFAVELLRSELYLAGFPNTGGPIAFVHEPEPDCQLKPEKATMSCDDAGGDVVTLQYAATRDCLGQDVSVEGVARNHYFVVSNQLRCRGNGGDTWGVVAHGVRHLRLQYGLDDNLDRVPERYLGAERLTAEKWERVIAVRFALLVETEETLSERDLPARSYRLLDGPLLGPFADQRPRQVITMTVVLRNQLPLPELGGE